MKKLKKSAAKLQCFIAAKHAVSSSPTVLQKYKLFLKPLFNLRCPHFSFLKNKKITFSSHIFDLISFSMDLVSFLSSSHIFDLISFLFTYLWSHFFLHGFGLPSSKSSLLGINLSSTLINIISLIFHKFNPPLINLLSSYKRPKSYPIIKSVSIP